MRAWIERTLDEVIFQIDVGPLIGVPEQVEHSAQETVGDCTTLLETPRRGMEQGKPYP